MSFPVVEGYAVTLQDSPLNPVVVNLPSGIQAGELLVAFVFISGNHNANDVPSGWTVQQTVTSTGPSDLSCWLKVATGSEGSTASFTNSIFSVRYSAIVYRISNYKSITRVDSEGLSAVGTGESTSNVPALSMPFGQRDYLYLNSAAWRAGNLTLSAGPANFTNTISSISPTTGVGYVSQWGFRRNFANPNQPATTVEVVSAPSNVERFGLILGIDSGDGLVYPVSGGVIAEANANGTIPNAKLGVSSSVSASAIATGKLGDIFKATATVNATANTSATVAGKRSVTASVAGLAGSSASNFLVIAFRKELIALASVSLAAYAERNVKSAISAQANVTANQYRRIPFSAAALSQATITGDNQRVSPVTSNIVANSSTVAQINNTVAPSLTALAKAEVGFGASATIAMSGSITASSNTTFNVAKKAAVQSAFNPSLASAYCNIFKIVNPSLIAVGVASATSDWKNKPVRANATASAFLSLDASVRYELTGVAPVSSEVFINAYVKRKFEAFNNVAAATVSANYTRNVPVTSTVLASANIQGSFVRKAMGEFPLTATSMSAAKLILEWSAGSALNASATVQSNARRFVLVSSSVSASSISVSVIYPIIKIRSNLNAQATVSMGVEVHSKYFLSANIIGTAVKQGRIYKKALVYPQMVSSAQVKAYLRGATGQPAVDWRRAFISRDLRKVYI